MSVVKYSPFALRHVDRDEFLTPFDRVFDEVFAAHFPELNKELGVGFFEKQSYPRVDVIDYNDIKTGLKEKIKDIPIDIVLRSELPETLFYRYYYTKFINIKTSENSKYIFKLNDFKTYMLKEAEKIRRDNNSKPAGEISIEYGVINSVILTIEQKFNTSFLNDMGLSSNENYDESNFSCSYYQSV